MGSRLEFAYMLYVDGEATLPKDSLDAAQKAAEQYMSGKAKLQIISCVAPAPSRTWNYEYDIGRWAELIRQA